MRMQIMDNSKEDFQLKLRSWFQNRGIVDKLILYLRSQMFVELQNHSNWPMRTSENNSISPKFPALKLLIADFLFQENLLFTLSVFCSEVHISSKIKPYTNYVSQLANMGANPHVDLIKEKPKFTKTNILEILEALGIRLSKEEIGIIYEMYKSERFNSLLFSLLHLLPVLLKKSRGLQKLVVRVKKREKYCRKLMKLEKIKVKRMYSLLENTHDIVSKHKSEMNQIIQKENFLKQHSSKMENKLAELSKKENELNKKEEYLISKEKDFEQFHKSKIEELEKKSLELAEKYNRLDNDYKKLLEERKNFDIQRELWIEKTNQTCSSRAYETAKLEEYELKFRTLQDEVFEILRQCRETQKERALEVDNLVNKEIQCCFDMNNQSQQTETSDMLNLEEYVNLMEKENTLLKSSSFKQRQCIAQLSTEIVFLKNRLDYLEKDLQIKTEFERRKEMNEIAEKLYSPKIQLLNKDLSNSSFRIRRKLFHDKEIVSSTEYTSSSSKQDNSLTDELVADAKNKLKQLENESEALNKNFKNLQSVLSKNISFNEKASSTSDSSSGKFPLKYSTSPQISARMSNYNVRDSESNLESSPEQFFDRRVSHPIAVSSPKESPLLNKNVSFKKMYLKYKESKHKEENILNSDKSSSSHEQKNLDQKLDEEVVEALSDRKFDENSNKTDGQISFNDPKSNDGITSDSKLLFTSNDVKLNEENVREDPVIISRSIEEKKITADSVPNESDKSSIKTEGEISAGSKDSQSSSDFWK